MENREHGICKRISDWSGHEAQLDYKKKGLLACEEFRSKKQKKSKAAKEVEKMIETMDIGWNVVRLPLANKELQLFSQLQC